MQLKTRLLLPLIMIMGSFSTLLAVEVPAIFGSHMVLQQNAQVPIWGWGKAGEKITLTSSWDQQPMTTQSNPDGRWQFKLNTPNAGGPHSITIKGYNTLVLEDVLIGEVWLVSGQSNMEWTASMGIDQAEEEIRQASHPTIRFFSVAHRTAEAPQMDLGGQWVASSPESMKNFSAVAYFFARELQKELGVPIGLINSSWGGTPAEVWVSSDTISGNPLFASEAARLQPSEWWPHQPGKLFHAMIAPLIPFQIKGVLWYQGESNTYSPEAYASLLPALIQNWRNNWGYEFPFYFAQIAPYQYGRPQEGVMLRDAQRRSLAVPKTGMVVTSDIGNISDIHPTNKQDVGKRFAHIALNQTYDKKSFPVSGPLYREMKTEGSSIRLYFDHAEKGLVSRGRRLTHFEIAGPDQKFVPAQAKIVGNTVMVRANGVKNPVAVRFAWSNTAEPNLFNTEGLPASAFRTDDWEIVLE